MQDGWKAVWRVPCVSVAFFPSLKQNFIAYRSSKVSSRPDCIFEIHLLWQWGFSRVYSNCCCSCSFEPEIIRIGQSSHTMYSNNIVNFQESTTILNACTKKSLENFWLLAHAMQEKGRKQKTRHIKSNADQGCCSHVLSFCRILERTCKTIRSHVDHISTEITEKVISLHIIALLVC